MPNEPEPVRGWALEWTDDDTGRETVLHPGTFVIDKRDAEYERARWLRSREFDYPIRVVAVELRKVPEVEE